MADNRALFYAIVGIIFMSMVVPLVLNPLPVVTKLPEQANTEQVTVNLAGSAAYQPNNPPISCFRHGAIDVYTKGYISYDGVNYVDYCSGSKVVEMVCSADTQRNSEKTFISHTCDYGCEDGACIR